MENFIIQHKIGLYLKAVAYSNQTIYTLSKHEWVFSAYDYGKFIQEPFNKFTFSYKPNEFTTLKTPKTPSILIDLFDGDEQEATRVHELAVELFKLVDIHERLQKPGQYNQWLADVYNQFIHDVSFRVLYLKYERKICLGKLMFSYYKFFSRISGFIHDKITELDRISIIRNVGHIIALGRIEQTWFLCDETLQSIIINNTFRPMPEKLQKRILSAKSFNDRGIVKLIGKTFVNRLLHIYFRCLSVYKVDISNILVHENLGLCDLIDTAIENGYTASEDLEFILRRDITNTKKKTNALMIAMRNGIRLQTLPKNVSSKKIIEEINRQNAVNDIL